MHPFQNGPRVPLALRGASYSLVSPWTGAADGRQSFEKIRAKLRCVLHLVQIGTGSQFIWCLGSFSLAAARSKPLLVLLPLWGQFCMLADLQTCAAHTESEHLTVILILYELQKKCRGIGTVYFSIWERRACYGMALLSTLDPVHTGAARILR